MKNLMLIRLSRYRKPFQIVHDIHDSLNLKVKSVNDGLISVNEKEELQAQKAFYDKIKSEMGEKRMKRLEFWQRVSLVYLPVMAVLFVALYWLVGLKNAGIL